MNILLRKSIDSVSEVFVGETSDKKGCVEFVNVYPEIAGNRIVKKVVILSSQVGCPIACTICDAGHSFARNLKKEEMLFQADYMYNLSKKDFDEAEKLKIQFARMGEPSLNHAVLDAMLDLKDRFRDYIPCIATIAPAGSSVWFDRLLKIRGEFKDVQLQFSIITTDEEQRSSIIKFPKQSFKWINEYAEKFRRDNKRKAVLNFPICPEFEFDIMKISMMFSKENFIVKMTPLNPTAKVLSQEMIPESYEKSIEKTLSDYAELLKREGFDTIVSIGNMMENQVGSNCGQSVLAMQNTELPERNEKTST